MAFGAVPRRSGLFFGKAMCYNCLDSYYTKSFPREEVISVSNLTGLVLEGGGMRGLFTAGVLDFFLDKDLCFDRCLGVSAGSCHACSFISKQRGRAFRVGTDYLNERDYCSTYSLLRTGDLFGAEFLYDRIPNELDPFDYAAFDASPTEFYPVVTNCQTGEAVYPLATEMHRDIQYVRASSSLPLVSRMVWLDGSPYLDGGITDSVPIRKSQAMGCVKNVVVLTRPAGYRKQKDPPLPLIRARYWRYPKLVKAMEVRHLRYNETMELLDAQEAAGETFVIRPAADLDLGRVEKDLDKLTRAYQAGYAEAQRVWPALQAYLGL